MLRILNIFLFHRTIIQHLLTADMDMDVMDTRSFVHCASLLAVATPVRKTFTTDVGQTQRRRHHMTARGLELSSF